VLGAPQSDRELAQRVQVGSHGWIEAGLDGETPLTLDHGSDYTPSDRLDHVQDVLRIDSQTRDRLAIHVHGQGRKSQDLFGLDLHQTLDLPHHAGHLVGLMSSATRSSMGWE